MEPPRPEKKPVRVTIFNQPYTLLAAEPAEVQELADTCLLYTSDAADE